MKLTKDDIIKKEQKEEAKRIDTIFKFCPGCGFSNDKSFKFCPSCGGTLVKS
jgi:rRNA maturation endonuclease Nob1